MKLKSVQEEEEEEEDLPSGPLETNLSTLIPNEERARPVDPVVTILTLLKNAKCSFTNSIMEGYKIIFIASGTKNKMEFHGLGQTEAFE